ncbi:MAG TPA: peptide chain release factor 1 [Firmicutes bacterium]|nr:peptide chain release factor 1 [Bacillota bacterium]
MFEKLEELVQKYHQLTQKMSDPEVAADAVRYQQVAKACSAIEEIALTYEEYKKIGQYLAEAREVLAEAGDEEMRELAEHEIETQSENLEKLEHRLKILLLPKDPRDEKNVIMEIRAGAGGEEAALFAADLFRMYARYAESKGWRTEIMSASETELGGFKEVIFMIHGRGAYSRLKYESGVHRVQRVPETEASGRIHTSTVTVAVLPEAEEVDFEISPSDLRIDVFRSQGHGGQSVNTTDSAVRITHLPTGMVVTCQDEKSQLKNREKALKVLRARLLAKAEEELATARAQERRSQVGSGDRSERIRTYNFPQNRCTDHRIGYTSHNLPGILLGELDQLMDALFANDQAEKLKEVDTAD